MRFRRAVVTGGAGFLGSHLCEELLRRGVGVVCLDNFLTGTPASIAHLIGEPRFRVIKCDVTDFVHIPGDVDLVLHLASAASPADYLRFPVETLKVGSLGTLHALGLASEKDARFVLASTSEVYGDPLEHPQRESYWGNVNPVGPRSVYDEAKRFAEALATAYRCSRGTDTAIVRIFNTYGPRMRPDDGRAIPTFIRQALAGQALTVTGDGTQTRSVCYVDDTIRGILALAEAVAPGPVNIGGPDELSMDELAAMIAELACSPEVGRPEVGRPDVGRHSTIEHVPRPEDDPRVRRPDTTLARELLGWEPQVSLRDGLARTVDWFRTELSTRRMVTHSDT